MIRRAKVRRTVLVVCVLMATMVAIPVCIVGWEVRAMLNQVAAEQEHLFERTDRAALSRACEYLFNHRTALTAPDAATNQPNDVVIMNQELDSLPMALRSLQPTYIVVPEDRVTVELGGGFGHCGVRWFPANVAPIGSRELAPGLWFYSEG